MELTDFTFYKNTPFTDFSNTILFDDNDQRDKYFNENFSKITHAGEKFNFIRDRGTITVGTPYHLLAGVNYCKFTSDIEPGVVFYAYVIDYNYRNPGASTINILVDVIMTYCQGNVLNGFRGLSVSRKHLNRLEYNSRIDELKNNDDVIKTFTKKYTDTSKLLFKDLSVLIQSSCSLTTKFGKVDDPKIDTSKGITFDGITSPVNLYVIEKKHFNEMMGKLAEYPWITQNIRSVSLIPTVLIEGKTVKEVPEGFKFDHLYSLRNNATTEVNKFDMQLLSIGKTSNQLYDMFGLDRNEDKHLLRNEYTTTEVYTYNGGSLFIDNGLLSEKYGLFFLSSYMMGYHNEVAVYVENYKSVTDHEGSFLNDAIFIQNFDDVPIMIDNYNLSLAKSANQRQLAESKLITNKVANIADSGADPKDRFFNAASMVGNLSPMNFFGKFADEHDFYAQQQAEFKDIALDSNSITGASNNNSLAIARGFFGLTVKHAQPNDKEWDKIKTYYKMFGYSVNDEHSRVNPRTMTICDYVKFTGQFMIAGADIALNEMVKAQFENGVRFWHYNGLSNPMEQNVLNNRIRS